MLAAKTYAIFHLQFMCVHNVQRLCHTRPFAADSEFCILIKRNNQTVDTRYELEKMMSAQCDLTHIPSPEYVDWTMKKFKHPTAEACHEYLWQKKTKFESQLLLIMGWYANCTLQYNGRTGDEAGHLKRRNYAILWLHTHDWFDLFFCCLRRQQTPIYCRKERYTTNLRIRIATDRLANT